jgi:hypothetical protein
MRQTISGLVAAIALTAAGAAPAMACGYGGCAPSTYADCGTCGGWAHNRLTDPETQYHTVQRAPQYYYVNTGPTYTGPGAFAPYPHVSTYHWRHHYSFQPRHSYRYGYVPHHHARYGYHHGQPVLRRYD